MSNGLSYPAAKKIYKKSLIKHRDNLNLQNMTFQTTNDSIISENSKEVHFEDPEYDLANESVSFP